MPPKLKSDTEKPMIGQPDSVLAPDFILATQHGNLEGTEILPFSGPLQLPSREQVLKLYFFIRDFYGKKNTYISQENIAKVVAEKVSRYWAMAGFKTVVEFRVIKHIKKELDMYQGIRVVQNSTFSKNHSSTPLLNVFRGIYCDPDQF